MADEEGLRWWIRYVIVPLIGGGGIIGIIIAVMEQPKKPSDTPAAASISPSAPISQPSRSPLQPEPSSGQGHSPDGQPFKCFVEYHLHPWGSPSAKNQVQRAFLKIDGRSVASF